MKRWRPPTRPLVLIALLLLVGAVVNVAVAWFLLGAPRSWTPGGPQMLWSPWDRIDQEARERGERLTAELWEAEGLSDPEALIIERGLGWTYSGTGWFRAWWVQSVECGWPLRSMKVNAIRVGDEKTEFAHSPSLKAPDIFGVRWFGGDHDRLPLTPIAVGFAINTLFYTAILALPLSFFPIRRRLRARRGRCPKCGYDLAGLGGAEPGGAPPAPNAERRGNCAAGQRLRLREADDGAEATDSPERPGRGIAPSRVRGAPGAARGVDSASTRRHRLVACVQGGDGQQEPGSRSAERGSSAVDRGRWPGEGLLGACMAGRLRMCRGGLMELRL